MENIIKIWKEILKEVEPEMMPAGFNTWIKPLVPKSIDLDSGVITLVTYNDMTKSILQNRYVPILESSIQKIFGTPMKLEFVLSDQENRTPDKPENDKEKLY